jgi:hypothetical protein
MSGSLSKQWMRRTVACFVFIVVVKCSFSQAVREEPKVKHSFGKRELGFIAGPAYSNILSETIKDDKYASSRGVITVNAGANYFLPVNKHIGYCVGLEFNQFKNVTSYKGYFTSTETRKSVTGGMYYPLVDANYTSTLNLTVLDIPLLLRSYIEVKKNIEVFLDAGLKLNAILSYKQQQSGYLSRKELYPFNASGLQYVMVPSSDTTFAGKATDVESPKVGFSLMLAAGVKAFTSEKTFVTFNFAYVQGFSDMNTGSSDYTNVFGDKFQDKKTTVFQLSLRVGFGFKIE